MNIQKLFPFLFLGVLISTSVYASEVNVSASLDKHSAQVNEEVRLTIRIEGAQGNISAPRLPAFQNADTFYTGRASRLTFVNGQSSSSVDFSYVIVPKAPGRLPLSPIEVQVGNERYKTDPDVIEVVGGATPVSGTGAPSQAPSQSQMPSTAPQAQAGQPAAQEPPPVFAPSDDNIFVKAEVDKNVIYPNEQIVLSYSLYTRYDTRYEGFQEEPQTSGFWIEEFPMEREVPRETVRVNGKRYVKAEIKKIALFPTAPAAYTIHPGSIKVSIRQEQQQSSSVFDEFFNDNFFSGGSFFARRENRLLQPPPIQVTVKPLPPGAPEGFNGAVGLFRMTSSIDKQSVKQDDPVTMKLVIEGEGNVETLNKPKLPELAAFKVYDSDTSSQLFKNGNVIGGRKTFEIVFIPIQAGALKIPKMEFSFFNPRLGTYQALATPEYALQVSPTEQAFKMPENLANREMFKKDIKIESKDVRYIQERIPEDEAGRQADWLLRILIWCDGVLTLLVFAGLFRDHREKIFAKDNALKRRTFARSQAESGMRRLKSLSRARDARSDGKYFDEVEKILTQYLSNKFNLSALGSTRIDLERHLEQTFGGEDPLCKDIFELYRICDESRFAKAQVPADVKAKALRILHETIGRVEKIRR